MAPALAEPVWTDKIPNRSPEFIIVSLVFIIITTGFFAFRQGWRWAHRQRGWDDLMAAIAYAILVIETVFGGVAAHYGFGKHFKQIESTAHEALMYFYLYQICYKLLGGFTKLTFCFLYLRIFNQKRFHALVIAVMAIVAVGSLAFAIGTVFQCTPVHRAWDRSLPGTCIDNTAFWYTHAAFNSFMDIVIFIMPIPMIGSLKLARGQKTGLISIFCLGAFVIAASVVRMVMLRSSASSDDPTWGSLEALLWTEIEANTSVICCCLPALRVPFLSLWHKVRRDSHTPTLDIDGRQGRLYDNAWTGPSRSHAGAASNGFPMQPQPIHSKLSSHACGIVSFLSGGRSHNRSNRPTRHQATNGSSPSDDSEMTKTSPSSKHVPGSNSEAWYDRVIGSIGREKDDTSLWQQTHDTIDDAYLQPTTAIGAGIPRDDSQSMPYLEQGGIYKTTDVHVSMHDLPPRTLHSEVPGQAWSGIEEETEGARSTSLHEVLRGK